MSGLSHDGIPLTEKYSPIPKPITRERYDQMLNCLPPNNWRRDMNLESFQLCELAYDNITLICAWDYITDRGWEFYGPMGSSGAYIMYHLRDVRVEP